MAENSKSVADKMEKKEILQKVRPNILLETMTKMLKIYFGHVMRTHQSLYKGIMLGITAGKEKSEALYAVDGRHQKCNWTFSKLVKDKKVALISEQHSQEEKTNQCLIQGKGNGKLLL